MLEQEALDRLQANAFKLSTVQKPRADNERSQPVKECAE